MSKPRVLLVDDEPSILAALEMVLEDDDWGVVCVSTAEEALERFESDTFDAVITDKNLPGMSGVELTRNIRELDGDVRIVMMTGYASVESGVETLNLGVDAYLEKPFRDIFEVRKVVAEVLASRRERMLPGSTLRRLKEALETMAPPDEQPAAEPGIDGSLAVVIAGADEARALTIMDLVRNSGCVATLAPDPSFAEKAVESEKADLLVIDSGHKPMGGLSDLEADGALSMTVLPDVIASVRASSPGVACAVVSENLSLTTVKQLIGLGVRALIDAPLDSAQSEKRIRNLCMNLLVQKLEREKPSGRPE